MSTMSLGGFDVQLRVGFIASRNPDVSVEQFHSDLASSSLSCIGCGCVTAKSDGSTTCCSEATAACAESRDHVIGTVLLPVPSV